MSKRGRPIGSYSGHRHLYGPRDPQRAQQMRELRTLGMTYAMIGLIFGVTRQAVYQTLYPEKHTTRQREYSRRKALAGRE